jgi:hypothetical protein
MLRAFAPFVEVLYLWFNWRYEVTSADFQFAAAADIELVVGKMWCRSSVVD